MSAKPSYDFAIAGCGMAGASVAYELSLLGARVLILETEAYPAFHTTGRSAAFYMEAYGNETVRKITQASRDFFDNPPEHFTEQALLKDCGALYLARKNQQEKLLSLYQELKQRIKGCRLVDQNFIQQKLPLIKKDIIHAGFWEPLSKEIDVASLLAGYIKLAKKNGAEFMFNQSIKTLARNSNGWLINETHCAKVLINAAGAWADELAQLAGALPLGLIPKKRTLCVAKPSRKIDVSHWPLTLDIDEQFYFKPAGNFLLITPADETPSFAHDVQADELDVALGIDRVQQVMDIEFNQVQKKWAGLRTFSLDKSPVVGFDKKIENFFWLAGQGGYGIQMAPALAKIAATLATHKAIDLGTSFDAVFDISKISPHRFS